MQPGWGSAPLPVGSGYMMPSGVMPGSMPVGPWHSSPGGYYPGNFPGGAGSPTGSGYTMVPQTQPQAYPGGYGGAGGDAYQTAAETEYSTRFWEGSSRNMATQPGGQYASAFPTEVTKATGPTGTAAAPAPVSSASSVSSQSSQATAPGGVKPPAKKQWPPFEDKVPKLDATEEKLRRRDWRVCVGALTAIVVLGVVVNLVAKVCQTLLDEDFIDYVELGGQAVWRILIAYIVAGVLVLLIPALPVALKELKSHIRFGILVIIASITIMIMCAITYHLMEATRPGVYRTVNLLCQDVTVRGCDAAMITPARRRRLTTGMSAVGGGGLEEDNVSFEMKLPLWGIINNTMLPYGPPPDKSPVAARANQYLQDLVMSNQEICPKLIRLCEPPFGFSKLTSCSCQGHWELAHTSTFTTTTTTGSTTTTSTTSSTTTLPSTTTTSTSLLVQLITQTVAAGAVQPLAGSGVPGASLAASGVPGAPLAASGVPGALPQADAPPRRLVVGAPPPWFGTEGAYCERWSPDGAVDGMNPWCYVGGEAVCPNAAPPSLYITGDGRSLYRSSGPCTHHVDSSSEVAKRGLEATLVPLHAFMALAVTLLVVAVVTFASPLCKAYDDPRHPRDPKAAAKVALADAMETRDIELLKTSIEKGREIGLVDADLGASRKILVEAEDEYLEMEFENAKQMAMERLSESTPEDMVVDIYAFYSQAVRGPLKAYDPPEPYFWQTTEKLKYDTWEKLGKMSKDEAKRRYINVANRLPVDF